MLHLLRAHGFKRAQSFAHASDLRALGCIKATGPSVVILSAGMRPVTEAPIREQMQSLHRDLTSAPIIIPNLINVPTETVTSTEIGIQSAKRRQRSR